MERCRKLRGCVNNLKRRKKVQKEKAQEEENEENEGNKDTEEDSKVKETDLNDFERRNMMEIIKELDTKHEYLFNWIGICIAEYVCKVRISNSSHLKNKILSLQHFYGVSWCETGI